MQVVIYDSLTNNTKKIAKAIAKSLNFEILPVQDVIDVENYENIIFGFFIKQGVMSDEALRVAKMIKNRKIGLFMTLGSDPKNEYADDCFKKAKKIFEDQKNEITKEFFCQGAISDEVLQNFKNFIIKSGKTITPQMLERWKKAASHPDKKDLQNAVEVFKDFLCD